jgi:hypothetical protein
MSNLSQLWPLPLLHLPVIHSQHHFKKTQRIPLKSNLNQHLVLNPSQQILSKSLPLHKNQFHQSQWRNQKIYPLQLSHHNQTLSKHPQSSQPQQILKMRELFQLTQKNPPSQQLLLLKLMPQKLMIRISQKLNKNQLLIYQSISQILSRRLKRKSQLLKHQNLQFPLRSQIQKNLLLLQGGQMILKLPPIKIQRHLQTKSQRHLQTKSQRHLQTKSQRHLQTKSQHHQPTKIKLNLLIKSHLLLCLVWVGC